MANYQEYSFSAIIEIIGINPYVFVPETILQEIFKQANKQKGPIPVKGAINEKDYKQTLVKYSGYWRLYINLKMLKNSPKRIGETIQVTIAFDPEDRSLQLQEKLVAAFSENTDAKKVFDGLSSSKQQEIIRYISRLKTEESIIRNVQKTINFLNGKERFLGRDRP